MKHTNFEEIIKHVHETAKGMEDTRNSNKIKYEVKDCLLSGLAMMFFQENSVLQFQQSMQDKFKQNNLKSMFGVSNIPKDTQMRSVLDACDPEKLEKVFEKIISGLQKDKILEKYKFYNQSYLISIDGSEYFSSEKVNCPHCLRKTSSETKKTRYSHHILQAVMIHPDRKQIIPFAPEQISNEDGTEKQDCEMNAGKRMIEKIRKAHPKMKIILTADGLYPKTPFLEVLEENKMSYIIRAKEGGNPEVFSWAKELRELGTIKKMTVNKEKEIIWEYEWLNNIPLTGRENSKMVNYAGVRIINPNSQKNPVTFTGHWVTDIEITKENVEYIVSGGRARWKIENEGFNTLKNHGYELTHKSPVGFCEAEYLQGRYTKLEQDRMRYMSFLESTK